MKKPFHLMAKPTSYQCNLDCDYCFYLEKERFFNKKADDRGKEKITHMSDEVLKSYVKHYIAGQDSPIVEFAWQGGEPTLAGLDFFERAVEYQKEFAGSKEIVNCLQTNGVLLDDSWCEFLKKHNFLVGLSIDGPEELHDHYRPLKGDKPSFKKVMRGIETMKKHGVKFNTLTVINNINVEHPVEVYNFLKSIGSEFMQFIPVVEQMEVERAQPQLIFPKSKTEKQLTPFSVDGSKYGDFMVAVFDQWVRKDVGKVFVQLFDNALAAWHGEEPNVCVYRKECGDAMIIERNGDIYSCDHYVYPEYRLGNVMDGKIHKTVTQKFQKRFGQDKANVGAKCESCEFRHACNGGCPKQRIHQNDDGTLQNHLCPGYKKIFGHMDPYMKYMANELTKNRAPANIMHVASTIAKQQSQIVAHY
ncbi:MAG: anaerobic sulfatase maturase [Endozoicomonas sp.]|uniref:anaerobic sulfatase maturase n=1 Tax=Endozoicomonas sp. TaxID=1892382 RepID=UPI003D9B1666